MIYLKLLKTNKTAPGYFRFTGAGVLTILLVAAAVFILNAAEARAGESDRQASQIELYLQEAAENNPGLRGYFNEYLAALERVPQVGALPDPQLSFSYFVRPMEYMMGKQHADISLMQMFPWFGTLESRKDEATSMAESRYEMFRDKKNELFYKVRAAWYDLYELEERIAVMEENLELLEHIRQIALSRFGSPSPVTSGHGVVISPAAQKASGGMSDVLRVEMEINELKNRIEKLKESRAPKRAEFNRLLNRPAKKEVSLPDTLAADTSLADKAVAQESRIEENPLVKKAGREADAYESRIRTAKLEGRPDFGIGVNYMVFSSSSSDNTIMNGNNMLMPMVSISIPINRSKYRAKEKEAALLKDAAIERKEETVNELYVSFSEVKADLLDAERRVELYRNQTDLAKQTIEILLSDYSGGAASFEELLRVREQLLQYRLELAVALTDHNSYAARLEYLAGSGPEEGF